MNGHLLRWNLKSSPTKGGWWEQFKEAVSRLPDPPQPIQPWLYLPDGSLLDIDKMLEENTRLLEDLQMQRQLTANAQHNESLLARRAEALRKRWPAIHKQFFSTEKRKAK